jgi:N-formylglutamate amidohydrolase
MTDRIWDEQRGEGPLVGTAIHAGHGTRDDVAQWSALGGADRLREEDPFTDEWTVIAPTRVVGLRSRFEVDLNRPRERAVYRAPEDAWGLRVWAGEPPEGLFARSMAEYDGFYAAMRALFDEVRRREGRFFVYDLHTYNHRRAGPAGPAADPGGNPQVNVGTGTMDRVRWAPVVERFMADLRAYPFPGGALDVRENVKFRGGHFGLWLHETFPDAACAPAIEFKKFFMDEWTGEPDGPMVAAITDALRSTVPGVLEELERI